MPCNENSICKSEVLEWGLVSMTPTLKLRRKMKDAFDSGHKFRLKSQFGSFALSRLRLMNQINQFPNTVVIHRCKAFDGNIDQDGHGFS